MKPELAGPICSGDYFEPFHSAKDCYSLFLVDGLLSEKDKLPKHIGPQIAFSQIPTQQPDDVIHCSGPASLCVAYVNDEEQY